MKNPTDDLMKFKSIRNIFLFVMGFLALGALGGGMVLIISPSGELMELPLSSFNNMPFDSFLIPGIILFTVLGIFPALLTIALLKKPDIRMADKINIFNDMHWSWTFSIYVAIALIGWIYVQLIFLQGKVHWLHTFYMFYAVLIILIALLPQIRYIYRAKNSPPK